MHSMNDMLGFLIVKSKHGSPSVSSPLWSETPFSHTHRNMPSNPSPGFPVPFVQH